MVFGLQSSFLPPYQALLRMPQSHGMDYSDLNQKWQLPTSTYWLSTSTDEMQNKGVSTVDDPVPKGKASRAQARAWCLRGGWADLGGHRWYCWSQASWSLKEWRCYLYRNFEMNSRVTLQLKHSGTREELTRRGVRQPPMGQQCPVPEARHRHRVGQDPHNSPSCQLGP